MKKKKEKTMYDQDYLDCLEIFQEEYNYGLPIIRVEEYEEDENNEEDNDEYVENEVETAYIIIMKRFYDHECRETKLYRAFKSEEEAKCHLRKMKHEMEDGDRYKCYGGKRHFTAYLRSNRKIKYCYYIDDVDYW